MKFKELMESKQVGILYHFTSVINSFKIIKDNILISTRHPKDNSGTFISFTRNKNFLSQSRYALGGTDIAFVVDGNKLSNKYKFGQFNYYMNKDFDYENKVGIKKEQEERIKDKNINNFLNYVIEIWVFKSRIEYLIDMNYKIKTFIEMRYFNDESFTIDDIVKKLEKDSKKKVIIK